MKKSLLSAIISALAMLAVNAPATPIPAIHGTLTFNWTVHQQDLNNAPKFPGLGKTTVTGTGTNKETNVMQVFTDSFTTSTISSASLIALLAHSLNMTFPADSKLVLSGNTVYVADSTGANGTDVSSVLSVTNASKAMSGLDTRITTTKGTNTTSVANGTGSGDQIIIITYDDTANPPADGKTSSFTFIGENAFTDSGSSIISSAAIIEKSSITFTLHGVGYGTIETVDSNIQGTITGTMSGTETFPAIP